MALADIPFYGAYAQRKQLNEQAPLAELQQASGALGLLSKLDEAKQAEQLRTLLAQTGGDPEVAMEVALKAGNTKAAAQLSPLVKLSQERKAREETPRLLAELNRQFGPQPAVAAPQIAPDIPTASPADASFAAGATAPSPVDARQSRIAHLTALSMIPQYANNPVVSQRLQAEIDKMRADGDKAPAKRERIAGEELIQEEYDPATRSYKEIGRGPRFARQIAPTTATGKAEPGTGLSNEYGTDPTYKKTVDYWAQLLHNGGTLPPRFAQSGSGKKMMPDILNIVPTLGRGDSKDMLASQVDITGQKSEARAVGTRSAAVEMAAGEAREMMPILQRTSENFARTGYQPINKVLKAYQDGTGSVESRQFGAALNSFVNVYARAVSPSGVPTVSDKEHAREVLSTADSHEQLMGLLKVLDQEMTAAQHAPQRVRAAQRAGITGQQPAHGAPAVPAAPSRAVPDSGGWSIIPVPAGG